MAYEVMRERLDTRMKQLGLDQRDIADKIGVNEATISRIVNGFRGTRLVTAIAIAETLDCSMDWLFDLDVPSTTPEIGIVKTKGDIAYMSVDTWKLFQQVMGEKVCENCESGTE